MTKVLNVDALSSEQRTLILGGVEYPVLEMSVENFIATSKAAEELQSTNAGLGTQVESAIDLVLRSVPDVPREVLGRVPLKDLQTIVAFVRGDEIEATPEPKLPEGLTDGVKAAKSPRVRK